MDKIEEVLTQGVIEVLPNKEGLAKLMRQRKIRLYLGIDPTGPNIHLGQAIPLRKLRQFQELGHEVILLIGDFTTRIGDPSERESKRKPISPTQIKKNMATYKKQASKILDFKKAKIKYNSKWLAKLSSKDWLELTSQVTVPQLLERDMFQQRMKKGNEVWVNEFLYPLMQGYDSVAMNVDLEIGSTDQTFNMLVGRKLQKIYHQKEKYVLTTPMLEGLDGREMSQSYGNTINLNDEKMFFKIMHLRDELIIKYFELCTDVPLKSIRDKEKNLREKTVNPMDVKKELAEEITRIYHGPKIAKEQAKAWTKEVQEGELPKYIATATGSFGSEKGNEINALDLLMEVANELDVPSRSEAKRMIRKGSVETTDKEGKRKIIKDLNEKIKIEEGMIIRYGKKDYVRLG